MTIINQSSLVRAIGYKPDYDIEKGPRAVKVVDGHLAGKIKENFPGVVQSALLALVMFFQDIGYWKGFTLKEYVDFLRSYSGRSDEQGITNSCSIFAGYVMDTNGEVILVQGFILYDARTQRFYLTNQILLLLEFNKSDDVSKRVSNISTHTEKKKKKK
ncbi:MAG TPA: hypothetical protein VGE63_01210 [Candidatus Paceibacterota bacterium]